MSNLLSIFRYNNRLVRKEMPVMKRFVLLLTILLLFTSACNGTTTPGTNVTTSASEQPQNGMQFVEDIIDLLLEDGGWVPPLPPEDGQKPRILTEEEKDRVLAIASSLTQVIEAKMHEDVVGVETQYIWIGWNGSPNGASHLMHGAVENGTANLSNRSDRWFPGVKFIFNSIYGDLGRAGIHVAVNLETGRVVHSGAFGASNIMGSKILPEFPMSSIVQIWESEELIATGIVVGNGSQVLTILNYEVDTPDSLNLSVKVPGGDEYEATVQVIDSRTSATLLSVEGLSLPIATTGNIQDLLPEQQLFIHEWYIWGDLTAFRGTRVIYSTNQDHLPLTFRVHYPPEDFPDPDYVHGFTQGAIVIDESGGILGLVGTDFDTIFPHPTPFGFIPGVVNIDSALELLSPDAIHQPWANGPLTYAFATSFVTHFHSGSFPEYESITANLQELLGKMGEPMPSAELPQDFYEILRRDTLPTEYALTIVYASPIDLRNTDGAVVAQAKWVSFLYNTEEKPFTLLYGSGRLVIDGGFTLLSDLDDIVKIVPPDKEGL